MKLERIMLVSRKTSKKRWIAHTCLLRGDKHHSEYLQKAWNKYDEESFDFEMLEAVDNDELLDIAEQRWIDELNSYADGYNMRPFAESTRGYKHSEETKRKISASQKGREVPLSRRKKLSILGKGKKQSKETIQKRAMKLRGKKRTSEQCRKRSEEVYKRCGSKLYEAFDRQQYLKEWAREFDINYGTLRNRVVRGKMNLEEALLAPLMKGKRRDMLNDN